MEISKKKLSIVTDLVVILFSAGYFTLSFYIKDGSSLSLSSAFYPRLLSVLLFILGCLSLYTDVFGISRFENSRVKIGDVKKQLTIFATTAAFVVMWEQLHIFYPLVFLATLILVWIYDNEPNGRKKLWKAGLIAAAFTIFVYVVFGLALSIQFV